MKKTEPIIEGNFAYKLDHFFKLTERGTSVRTEILAGLTTFMTMAYILIVNPLMLKDAGMDFGGVFTATALAAIIATLFMGLVANLPIALASGMGLNAFFTYAVVIGMKMPWEFALAAVFVEGLIFMLLTLGNVREAIVNCIPLNVKYAISAGIGLFIAFIGLKNAMIIVPDGATFVKLGSFHDPKTAPFMIVALLGILISGALMSKNVKGSLLWGIVAATLIGIPLGVTNLANFNPGDLFHIPSLSKVFMKMDFSAVATHPVEFIIVLSTLLLTNLFDTVGTLIGVADKAKMLDKDGKLPGVNKALMADAVGTTCGAVLGTSVVAAYVESAAGVAEGGRTGLTAVMVAFMFFLALFLAPVFLLVPSAATAPALVVVGFLMMQSVKKIDLEDITEGLPAFLTIIMMPLTFSIAEGIVFGVLSYIVIKTLTGRGKEVPIATWIIGLMFVAKYVFLAG
jgi:AGZA family xanthine/uracil permease-like MFS transporter